MLVTDSGICWSQVNDRQGFFVDISGVGQQNSAGNKKRQQSYAATEIVTHIPCTNIRKQIVILQIFILYKN